MNRTDTYPNATPCRQLILMRHGEAHQGGVSDHARSLTPRGVADCQRIGQKLSEVIGRVRIICSDSTRTTQTCGELLKSLKDSPVTFDHDVYTASDAHRLIRCIAEQASSDDETLMVVGHNPTVSRLAEFLLGDQVAFDTSDCMILKSQDSDWSVSLQSAGTWQQIKYFSP